jgi:acetyltransferase-like isoleucine patch superfamily enzyme
MNRFPNWQQPTFDSTGKTPWNWVCQHHQNLKLGKGSDIGAFTYINAKNGVEIGEDVQIGSHCSVYSENTIDNTQGKVAINKGAKIGSHTVILPGVTIGANALVGAHSLVKNDIPDNETWAGVPARKIK